MRFLSTFVSGAALLVGYVNAYANPLACSGVCNNAHDPSVIRRDSDGTYFRFSTGGKVAIHTAPSIEGPWTYKGAMLPSGSKINLAGKDDLWAPEVQKIDGKYYVYYSVSSFGVQNSAIGVASSSTMDVGSWTDHGSTGVSSSSGKPYNAIDANMVQVGSTWYMNFGSFWSDIFQVPMKSATAISGSSTQIAFDPSGTHAVEGAYMMYRSGYYYLFFSHGQCCGFDKSKPAAGQEYKIKVCRSKTATGGFVDKAGTSCTNGGGTIVLESHGNVYGPGGQSVYNDPKNGWILLYHYVDTKVGYADGQKKFGWNKISWSGGWPSV